MASSLSIISFLCRLSLYCFIAFCPFIQGYGQYQNVWVFGTKGGIDFNANPPQTFSSAIEGFGEANASICDARGNLLFYTEGSFVWDSRHKLMPNGSDLLGPSSSTNGSATTSATQGAVIVPVIDQVGQYYIFSLGAVESEERLNGRLFYSVVDMNLNGGLGDVVEQQKGILVDSLLTEKMAAVVGNRCNIWLMTYSRDDRYKAYEITRSGLNLRPVVSAGGFGKPVSEVGSLVFRPDGTKIANTTMGSPSHNPGCVLADFDLATGEVRKPIQIRTGYSFYSAEFSAAGTRLYLAEEGGNLYQFDLSSNQQDSIIASRSVISLGISYPASALRRGPDNKIYFITQASVIRGSRDIGVIHNPDAPAAQVNIEDYHLKLPEGALALFGLPTPVPLLRQDTIITANSDSIACFMGQFLLAAADVNGWHYLWNTGDTTSGITATRSGTYWVSYSAVPCLSRTDTFHVYIPPGRLPALHQVKEVCKGTQNGHALLERAYGDTTAFHFQWRNSEGALIGNGMDSLGNLPAGAYSVQITTPQGCDTILCFELPEVDYKVSFTLQDTIVCSNTPVVFTNTSHTHFAEFEWETGDATQSRDRDLEYSYKEPGQHQVRLIGRGPYCIDTFSRFVEVDDPDTSFSFKADPGGLCQGEAIYLTPHANGTVKRLIWSLGDETRLESAAEVIRHAYAQAGTFDVKLKGFFRACPEREYEREIKVFPLPGIDLGRDTALCLNGQPIVLYNRASPQAGYQYEWSTGGRSDSLKVTMPGIYRLSVSNLYGCRTAESVTIMQNCYIDLPNAFTPNGDGINDYFFPRSLLSKGGRAIDMKILDRWGHVVFETKSRAGCGWDGRLNGQNQPAGVYLYAVQVTFSDGHIEKYTGTVTLMR